MKFGLPVKRTGLGKNTQIRPRDYFDAILPGLDDFPVNCVAELTPTVWVQTRR